MTSPFEQAGFTTFRLPQAAQTPTFVAQPAATAPANQPAQTPAAPSVPSAPQAAQTDTFTPSINRDELKEEIRKEILDEMKAQQELEAKAKAAEEKKKNKLGPVKRFKRFIGNVKKACVTAGEYTKGFFKGIFEGGIAGGVAGGGVYAIGKLIENPMKPTDIPLFGKFLRDTKITTKVNVKNAAEAVEEVAAEAVKEGAAEAAKNGKFITKLLTNKNTAIAVGGIVLAGVLIKSLWNASLNANEKRALIEHKYEETPVVRK